MLRPLPLLVLFLAAPLAALAACSSDPETSPGNDAGDAAAQDAATAETGDDDAAGGDDAGTEAAAEGSDFCSAMAARAVKCGDDPPTDCAKQQACHAKSLRPTLVDSVEECLPALACKESDDACFEEAAKPFHDEPAVTAYVTSCEAKRTACGNALPEDLCSPNMGVLKPAVLADLETCFEEECAGVLTCVVGVFTDLGCGM
jgi:hypothetical protein